MRMLRIGLAQLDPTVGDLDGNTDRILAAIADARARGVELLVFPEMMLTGYPPEDLLLKPGFLARVAECTASLAAHTAGMTVVVGSVEHDIALYNAAFVFHDGALAGTVRKRHLPNYGVFDERRYFESERRTCVFQRGTTLLGVNICEDIWVSSGPTEEQVVRGGAELIVNLSASPYHARKIEERRRMIATRSTDHRAVVCYVNMVGGQDEIVFDGGSLVMGADGQPLAEAPLFREDLLVVDVDLAVVEELRLHDARLREERAEGDETPMRRIVLGDLPTAAARPARPTPPAVRVLEPIEEVYEALALGCGDYVRKNGFTDVVLGLSGGIDSALTAAIAADALGPEHVVGVSMPSRFTSDESQRDAAELAAMMGIRLLTVPIREVMTAYEHVLTPVFEGRGPDLTEENLQARIRGNHLMALSNKFGWLVLTTGNKSETSVGYSTLYGDTAGGFAVLKDVYKTQVYALASWRNARGRVIPEYTITRAPSAELRPGQVDQDSLPPYEMLDAILKRYVEDDRAIADLVAEGFNEATVRRVARLVDLAEYKRRQSPPGIKITPRAFGKDRRLPITNRWRG